jgi:Domain of unknown function (DUF222)
VTDTALTTAHRLLEQAADAVSAVVGSGTDDELIGLLALCEGATRRLDRAVVDAVAALERRGTFAERGYKSTAGALGDLLGWERFEVRRRVVAAEQVTARVGLDGVVLSERLPATAAVFAAGRAGLRHVEAVAHAIGRTRGSDAPRRHAAAPPQTRGAAARSLGSPTSTAPRGHEVGDGAEEVDERCRHPPPLRAPHLLVGSASQVPQRRGLQGELGRTADQNRPLLRAGQLAPRLLLLLEHDRSPISRRPRRDRSSSVLSAQVVQPATDEELLRHAACAVAVARVAVAVAG